MIRAYTLRLSTFTLVPKGRKDVAGRINPRKWYRVNKHSPGGATFLRWGHLMSPLRGLGSCGNPFRGLKPTATSCCRCATEDVGKDCSRNKWRKLPACEPALSQAGSLRHGKPDSYFQNDPKPKAYTRTKVDLGVANITRSVMATFMLATCMCASADELQQQRSAHDRAVASVTEVVASVLDLQLQQLEVNRLDAQPIYRELRRSKSNLAALVGSEMKELQTLLQDANSPDEVKQESRRLARRVVVNLLAEQARVKKRRGGLLDRNSKPAEGPIDRAALAENAKDLQKLSESLDALLEKQARAKDLAERDIEAARDLEKSIAEDLKEADDDSVLDSEIESRLDQAQDAVDKAQEQLQDDSAAASEDRMQAVEAAEDALTEASVEVESQLSDVKESLESGSPSDSTAASDGVSKNQPSSGTTRDLGSGVTSRADQEIESRALSDEAWFARLPPELQTASRAKTRRPPPRGYENQLRDYFRRND